MASLAPEQANEQQQLRVTVMIVTYNGLKYLKACLDSVLDQDFPRERYLVMVIDNASQDGSADFVEQNYPDVQVVRMDKNYGPNRALTEVGYLLQTQYTAYLNQDVVVHRSWLSELWEVMMSHPNAGVVESNMILPSFPEFKGMRREGLIERAFVCDTTLLGTHEFRVIPVTASTPPVPVLSVYGAGTLSNLDILAQLDHVLDPDFFAYGDDLDLGLRLNITGFQVLHAPRSVLYHDTEWHFRWNMRSISRAIWVAEYTILAYYKSCYWSEFLYLLPYLLVGKLIKAGQDRSSIVLRILYAVMGIPLLLLGVARAVVRLPHFREKRRRTLALRKMPRGWVVNWLKNSAVKRESPVWNKLPDQA